MAKATIDELAAGQRELLDQLAEERAARLELEARLDTPAPYGLAAKLARIQGEIEDVPRRGHAEVKGRTKAGGEFSYSYDYILEADLMRAVRPLLARYGVATYYSDEILKRPERDEPSTVVRVTLELVDGDTGESRALTAEGFAIDYGDKGANKAKTSAIRYILWKTFLQPSDEDPEQDSQDAETASQRRTVADTAAGRGGARRRDPDAERQAVRSRLSQLAVELDDIHGRQAGRTFGELEDTITAEHGAGLADVALPTLVKVGQALAQHVTAERQAQEQQAAEFNPTPFSLPRA